MTHPIALVIENHAPRRLEIASVLALAGYDPLFASAHAAHDLSMQQCPQLVVFAATSADPVDDLACLAHLRARLCGARFLFLASVSSESLAIAALHSGAEGYVKEPWNAAMLGLAVRQLQGSAPLENAGGSLCHGERFVGCGVAAQQLRTQLARIAPTDSSVLITGETGTGKDIVSELIHHNSKRANQPFVCLNTAALPDTLVENELFGHERGAFTGAVSAQDGKIVAADGGTLFLDEIGDVSLPVQAKLLRAIENKTLYRVGGTRCIKFDVRIIAATSHDLERASSDGRFRSDLYYRLNVIRLRLQPLRERREDVPLLIQHYLRQFNKEMGRSVRGLSARAIDTLCAYHWPGNVRELRNAIEALLVNLAPETTGIVDLPPEVLRQLAFAAGAPVCERERMLQALAATSWNKSKAASELHWSRMTLYRKMREHQVDLQRGV